MIDLEKKIWFNNNAYSSDIFPEKYRTLNGQ